MAGPGRFVVCLIAALLLPAAVTAGPTQGGDRTLSGPGYSYVVAVPDGWSVQEATFADIVFHPADQPYESAQVMLYVRSVSKRQLGVRTVAELNALDLKGMRARWPGIESHRGESLQTRDGSRIPVYAFRGGQFHEKVAYSEHPDTITVFVVSAETRRMLDQAAMALRDLVGSYRWIADRAEGRPSACDPQCQPNSRLRQSDEGRERRSRPSDTEGARAAAAIPAAAVDGFAAGAPIALGTANPLERPLR